MKILASVRQDVLLGLAGLIVIVQMPGRASYRSRTPAGGGIGRGARPLTRLLHLNVG